MIIKAKAQGVEMLGTIISLFGIFIYTALGTYVLMKNPRESTNRLFVLLMSTFIIWSIGTYNIGLVAGSAQAGEVILDMKLQFSGVILALTFFFFFAFSLVRKEVILKNPIIYLIALPSFYILYLIWTSDISNIKFYSFAGSREEFFIFSAVFAVAGIYLLLRHYAESKYREHSQAKLILTGAIAAISIAIVTDIILPMFFDLYFIEFSTLAPAVMSIFFAYSVYQYGLFVKPVPELSVTSFCGTNCILCQEYLDEICPGCRFDRGRYEKCEIYKCLAEKGYKDCGECQEIVTCLKRTGKHNHCFNLKPGYDLKPGRTYLVEENGYDLFVDAVNSGAFGLVATTMPPQQVKEKYGIATTPVVWISDEAFDTGVKPRDMTHLSLLIINFMKKISNSIILLEGIDRLIDVNGFNKVNRFIQALNNTSQTTNSRFIVLTAGINREYLDVLKQVLDK